MLRGVCLSTEELLQEFSISRRMALRVVIFLEHEVEITPLILEETSKGSPLEIFFLDSKLLEIIQNHDWKKLNISLENLNWKEKLVCVFQSSVRVIAIEEELLALESEKKLGLQKSSSLSLLQDSSSLVPLEKKEAHQLFTPENISHLKVELFTNSNPSLRVEALRKMALSHLSPRDKKRLFLAVLHDKEEEVRLESVLMMVSLGLDSKLQKPLQGLLGEDPEQAIKGGVSLLRTALQESSPFSKIILMASFMRAFELFPPSIEWKTLLLDLMELVSFNFPVEGGSLENLLEFILSKLEPNNFIYLEKIRSIFVALGQNHREEIFVFLKSKLESVESNFEGSLILRVILDLKNSLQDTCRDFEIKIQKLILEKELPQYLEEEAPYFLFEDFLDEQFDPTVEIILSTLLEKKSTYQMRAIALLENLFIRVSPSKKYWIRLYKTVIHLLPLSSFSMVSWTINSKVMTYSKIPQALQEQFVEQLLYHLGRGQFIEFRINLIHFILSLGKGAFKGLLNFIQDQAISEELRKEVAKSLSFLILAFKKEQKGVKARFQKALTVLLKLYKNSEGSFKGIIGNTLGEISRSSLGTPKEMQKIAQTLNLENQKPPYEIETLISLSLLSKSPHLSREHQERLAKLFLKILGQTGLKSVATVRRQGGEIIFGENIHTRIHSDLIPYILEALCEICKNSITKLKYLTAMTLLVKWKKVECFEEIWSPFNIQRLMKCLEKIARHNQTPDSLKIRICQSFLKFLEEQESLVIVPSLSGIFLDYENLKNIAKEVSQFIHILLKMAKNGEVKQESEFSCIYLAFSQILSKGYFQKPHFFSLQKSLIQVLLKGCRENQEGAKQGISFILNHTNNEKLKKQLESYL